MSAGRIDAVDSDAACGRAQQPVEVAHERRLAAAVLADERHPLARLRRAGRRRRAPGPRPRRRRGRGPRPAAQPRIARLQPARRRYRRPPPRVAARPRQAARRRRSARRGSASTSSAGPRMATRPPSSTTSSVATSASRSVFCSATRIEAPSAARPLDRVCPTRRVPAGSSCAVGSSRTRWSGRSGEQPGDGDQLLLPARQAPRIALGEVGDAQRVERRPGPLHDLVARQPEVHRPEGDLLEDGLGHLRQLGRRVLEADADALAEPVHRPVVDVGAVQGDPAADLAADRPRRQATEDEAQRRLARLGRARQPHDRAVAQLEVDVEQRRTRGRPRSGSRPRRGSSVMSPRSPIDAGHDQCDQRERASDAIAAAASPGRCREAPRAGCAGRGG